MGWWWSSRSQAQQQQQPSSQPSDKPQEPPQPPSQPSPAADHDLSNKPLSRDERAEAEFREMLASLEAEANTASTSSQKSSNTTTTKSQSEQPSSKQERKPNDISFESLYPDEMSCRSAFDYAFFCQSFGGQWVNVYRYGELRSCSEHWENFWLCMKARTYPDEERKRMIRDHYRKKAVKYKTGPSSEDVWDVRTESIGHLAFKGDWDALLNEEKMKNESS